MKVLIISDIHGSSFYSKKIKELNQKENPDKIILLGDLYYHGHKYNINNLPEEYFDIMFYGHFHTGFIEKENGRIYANPGSISLPKNNSQHSYLIFQDKELILKDIDGNIIQKTNLGD